ncbi:condensin-2 complex subunit D3 isoform X2 [Patella vulgata]|uniref:condensin-2 complex subunit D3 isoform X2 n=1 Tax=Patella vulgata TaxID=6465 RepID=UPI0024A9BA29|nr:condensin-2 complex subunit D3 isoform X2 [Patella vulgata]
MKGQERIILSFSALPISILNEEWVKNVWEADFTDLNDIPVETLSAIKNNRYNVKELEACCSVLKQEKEGGLWTILVENDISLKSLVVLMVYLLETGSKLTSSYPMKEASVLAASLYIKLLTVPGSGAFKLFHPEIIVKCVEELKLFGKLSSTKRKASSAHNASNRKKSTSHSRSKRKKRTEEAEDVQEDDIRESLGGDDDEDNEEEEMTPSQCNRMLKLLTNLLQDLTMFFEVFSFKKSESTVHRLLPHIIHLTKYQSTNSHVDFDNWPSLEDMSVSCLAYRCLNFMCCTPSLNIPIINSVCKCLLPNLLMLGKSVVRADTLVVDVTVNFIRYLMKTYGEQTIPVISTLIQHMCTKVPDKADFRTTVAQAIVSLLQDFPPHSYAKLLEWLFQLSQHAKINHRTFSLEVITLLLGRKEPDSMCDLSDESQIFTKHKSLMGVVLARCSDLSPSVRAKAILGFSQCFVSSNTDVVSAMKNIVTPRTAAVRSKTHGRIIPTPDVDCRTEARTSTDPTMSKEGTPESSIQTISTSADTIATEIQNSESTNSVFSQPRNQTVPFTPFVGVHLTPGFNPDLTDNEGVISMLRRRSGDDNAGVRKAAVKALQNIILFEKPNFRQENLTTLKERCCDPSLSVRKQAIQSLTDILHNMPSNKDVQRAWLDGALPLIMDRENTLQEKCSELVEDVIFGNLTTYPKSTDEGHRLLWGLLATLSENEQADLRRYLQLACQTLSRLQKIKLNHINSLLTHVDTENNKGAWLLLYIIAQFVSKMNPQFVISYWEKHSQTLSELEEDTFERVLNVISYTSDQLTSTNRINMIDDLKGRLKKFELPPGLIAVIVKTLSKLCESQSKSEDEDSRSQRETWGVDLLMDCDEYLSRVIFEEKLEGDVDENKIICYLVTIGEIVQLCPAKTPQRIYLLVQSIIAGRDLPQEQNSQLTNSSQTSEGEAPIPSTQPFSQFRGVTSSNRVRTFAFTTLGKLLLQNEKLAKKCIPALARELETCTDVILRNNIVIIMCDLCIRYTTVIDNYVPNIAVCLKDRSPLIRKQTLTLLTRLLQEDFIKWKGVLFYRFITTLLDENVDIKDFAAFCMTNVLLQRQPTMFFSHFIECLFHFNGYTASAVYNKFAQSEREKTLFNLKGDQAAGKRLELYLFMLEHTSDQHKFQLTSKLCQDEIKISSIKNKPGGVEDEEQDMAAVVLATAKKQLITQVVKKNVIENIVPIVTSLKYILEKEKSPVLKDLMVYLQVLMKDFREEIVEILTGDKQLLKEIEFDIRKFEEQQTPVVQPTTTSKITPQDRQPDQVTPQGVRINNTSIQKTPPVLQMCQGTPKMNKPNGSKPLLSAAIFNSAKKNIERLQQVKTARNSPASKERRKSGVTWADENSKDNSSPQTQEMSDSNNKTPTTNRSTRSRAISTPAGALGNITFAIDQNVTLIPPSPIPLGDDSDLANEKRPNFDDDVVFLLSPERPLPKPKKWNIQAVKLEPSN